MFLLKGIAVVCLLDVWSLCRAEVSDSQLQIAVQSFSVDILLKLHDDNPGNIVASPVSLATLLAILEQGARDNTASQLEAVLHLTQLESKEGYGRLSRSWKAERNTTSVVEVASRLFVKEGLELRQDFQDIVSQDFLAETQQLVFGSGAGASAINSWVSEATHGRIPTIVDKELPPSTQMVLANAVYFKSPWLRPFKRDRTEDGNFHLPNGTQVIVPFMHMDGYMHAHVGSTTWVELPFLDGFKMAVGMANQEGGLEAALRELATGNHTSRSVGGEAPRAVSLALPRFKFSSKLDLKHALQQLDVTDVFDQGRADLRGMTTSEGLVVSKVYQKAEIEVDEDGATATAATIVEANRKSAIVLVDPIVIRFDRPFFVEIFDSKDIPLFLAIVSNPAV